MQSRVDELKDNTEHSTGDHFVKKGVSKHPWGMPAAGSSLGQTEKEKSQGTGGQGHQGDRHGKKRY